MNSYCNYTDEELIAHFRDGDDAVMDFILEKYKKTVINKAKTLYLMGGDEDDLIQEGMIGLFKAVMDYKDDRDASFNTFANLCISRQMYKAIQSASRKKNQPLNSYVSFYENGIDEIENYMEKGEGGNQGLNQNPEHMLIDQENEASLKAKIAKTLSALEQRVMDLYIEGNDYKSIALKLGKSPKSIDNTIQRIKNKLSRIGTK